MSLILSWVLFPLVLAGIGAGWGVLVERAGGARVQATLVLPLGLAAALVVAGTLTAFSATAPAAVPVVAVGAAIGLLTSRMRGRPARWPLIAAVGVLLAYGAPVLLSGHATFTGFVKLDDTATWFDVIDHLFSHGRSVGAMPPSTYTLVYTGDVGPSYPLGAFMLPGLARALTGVDIAWVFQPYLACCAAAVALCLYALMGGLIGSPRPRALVAFLGAQSALLYGYSLWGGIKELTASFLLVLGVAIAAPMLVRPPARGRALLPLAMAAGALVQTLGVGAVAWIAPAFVLVAASWWLKVPRARRLTLSSRLLAWLAAMTAALVVPVWVVLGSFLSNDAGLFSNGESAAARLGNLLHPLSVFQLAGIWPTGDFRATAPTVPSVLLIALAIFAAAACLWMGVSRRRFGLPLYLVVALLGCGLIFIGGATPWVVGKTLAISSPALLTAGLAGAVLLSARHRAALVVLLALTVGVLWSNALAYHDVQLAPRARLGELQHIAGLVAGRGPTLVNEYEVYADRHFLRSGAPVEPAEYRSAPLPLRDGAILTKPAQADIDSFPFSTLFPYVSIVTRRSPAESRPPSIYRLVWQGRYYQLWQRPTRRSSTILEHVPLGESNALPYCGAAEDRPLRPKCSTDPVALPRCARVKALGREAQRWHAELVAYQRPAPIVARADQTLWPASWMHDVAANTLTPTTAGMLVSHIVVNSTEKYGLWLGGSFARGFGVSVDGQQVGSVENELSAFGGYIHVADLSLAAGTHTIWLSYPHAGPAPGEGAGLFNWLSAIVLQPQSPASQIFVVPGRKASALCGRRLDWIEMVLPA